MKRALAALGTTVIGVVWLVTFKVTPLDVAAVSAPAPRTASPRTAPQPTPNATGGTFSGTTIDTRYGPVQVRIIVAGQKVVDVQPLQLPRDRARSAFISQYSAPILRTEAITAQTARIDIVSGATYTSIAYGRSLDSALKLAHLG